MIQTFGLSWQPPRGPALRFPDTEVAQGATLLLRGPSGSGKSTWLAMAAGLLTPTAGRVVVADQVVAELSAAARDAWRARNVGFLPQRLLLSEALNVADNLGLVYFAAGLQRDPEVVDRALQRLGVAHLAGRRPIGLSGGEAQRVALARALLLRPRVILADEPTASLDDAACTAALALLRESAGAVGATLVIATHDARVAGALPDASVLSLSSGVVA